MTVYARGYRTYEGPRKEGIPALAIAGEAVVSAWKRKSFKRIALFYLAWFAFCSFLLYLAAGADIEGILGIFGARGGAPGGGDHIRMVLDHVLRIFYGGLSFLTAMLAIFIGAPLIADDLAANAFPLYLVRPIRARDYVLGKLLVLPTLLALAALLPGLLFYVLAGVWHPPGQSWDFLRENLEVPGRVLEHWLLASMAYGGLMLLLSSRTPRRGLVAVLAGVAIFGGALLQGVGRQLGLHGPVGDLFSVANLPRSTTAMFARADTLRGWRGHHLPDAGDVRLFAAALLVIGCVAAWRRVRSVEVTS